MIIKGLNKHTGAVIAIVLLASAMCGCSAGWLAGGTPTSPQKVWDNSNSDAITGTAQNRTVVTFATPVLVSYVDTDHWNGGRGVTPGTIALAGEDGATYGPWPATGADGEGGIKNAYWAVFPNVTLKAGHYTVVDSDPSTWATNDAANDAGFATIKYEEVAG
ncbi:MAG TPA: hypothetical protein VLT35_02605 [Methanocella sp.]|nr:hypothetical protein [Methanocella sp.]